MSTHEDPERIIQPWWPRKVTPNLTELIGRGSSNTGSWVSCHERSSRGIDVTSGRMLKLPAVQTRLFSKEPGAVRLRCRLWTDNSNFNDRLRHSPMSAVGGGFNWSLQHRPKSIGRRFKSQGFPGTLV